MSGRGPKRPAMENTGTDQQLNPLKARALEMARKWAEHCEATLTGPLLVGDNPSQVEVQAAEAARNSVAATSNSMATMWALLAKAEPETVEVQGQ